MKMRGRRRRGGAGSPQSLHRSAPHHLHLLLLKSKLGIRRAPSPPRPLPASGRRASPSTPPAAGAGGRWPMRTRSSARRRVRVDGGFWPPSLERELKELVRWASVTVTAGRLRTLPCGGGRAGAHASTCVHAG
jgi:hypothetical protein